MGRQPAETALVDAVHHRRLALVTAAWFLLAGVIWVVGTDGVLAMLPISESNSQRLQSAKGLIYVSACTALVYWLVGRCVRPLIDTSRAIRVREREATARSQELSALMDAVPAAVWIAHDARAKSITGNRYAQELLRLNDQDNHSLTASESKRPGHFKMMKDGRELTGLELPVQRCAATGQEVRDFDLRLVFEDGSERAVIGNAIPILDRAGEPNGSVAAFIDVTDRERAVEQLRRERALFVGGPTVVWNWKNAPGWPVDYVSENVRQFGYSPADFTSGQIGYSQIVHPEDLQRVGIEVQGHIAAGNDHFEQWYRLRCADGSYRSLYDFTVVTRDPSGVVTHFLGYVLDATEYVQARQSLLESEHRYGIMFNENPQPLWVYERATLRMLEVNRATLELFGYSHDEFLELDLPRLVVEGERAALRNAALSVNGLALTGPWRAVRRDGSEFDAEVFGNDLSLRNRDARIVMLTDVSDRLRAERSLRESEERYRQFFDANQAVKLVVDPRTARLVDANAAAARFYGYSREQLLTMKITDINTADIETLRPVMALATEREQRSEFVHRTASGDLRNVEIYTGPIDIRGERYLFGIIHDITVRKEAEERLRRSEATNRALLDALPDLLLRMDREGRYLSYHAKSDDDLFVGPDQFLGKTAYEVLPAERAEQCMKHVTLALDTRTVQRYEFKTDRSGRSRWWEVRVSPSDADDVLLVLRDVTEARSARSLVRDLQQRRELIFNFAPVGILFLEPDFTVIEWNPGAQQILGYSAAEIVGKSGNVFIPEIDRPYVSKIWERLLRDRQMVRGSNQNVTSDGRIVDCEWYNAPLLDPEGKVFAVLSIVEDVSERRTAERRQQLMLSELDHRVKNNLATIMSLAQQTGRSTNSFEEFRVAFMGRLRALDRMHSELTRTKWEGAPLGAIAAKTLRTFSLSREAYLVDGPSVMLPPKYAQAITLTIHELATNAAKHGAFRDVGGRVELTWSVENAECLGAPSEEQRDASGGSRSESRSTLWITWQESGGPAVRPPDRRGFGSVLIDGMIRHELRGEVVTSYSASGVRCVMRVPMPVEDESGTGFGG